MSADSRTSERQMIRVACSRKHRKMIVRCDEVPQCNLETSRLGFSHFILFNLLRVKFLLPMFCLRSIWWKLCGWRFYFMDGRNVSQTKLCFLSSWALYKPVHVFSVALRHKLSSVKIFFCYAYSTALCSWQMGILPGDADSQNLYLWSCQTAKNM